MRALVKGCSVSLILIALPAFAETRHCSNSEASLRGHDLGFGSEWLYNNEFLDLSETWVGDANVVEDRQLPNSHQRVEVSSRFVQLSDSTRAVKYQDYVICRRIY